MRSRGELSVEIACLRRELDLHLEAISMQSACNQLASEGSSTSTSTTSSSTSSSCTTLGCEAPCRAL